MAKADEANVNKTKATQNLQIGEQRRALTTANVKRNDAILFKGFSGGVNSRDEGSASKDCEIPKRGTRNCHERKTVATRPDEALARYRLLFSTPTHRNIAVFKNQEMKCEVGIKLVFVTELNQQQRHSVFIIAYGLQWQCYKGTLKSTKC
ncbi:hypothetical protein M514_27448 [Trichuris suis]|uniref:Uncharacterized protein n=1 Tax=Trichuris suis TaxID=68888 RepID=A0A085MT17_9BILA|nr:hypothetical protein M514_27448 [Trichuris suis]